MSVIQAPSEFAFLPPGAWIESVPRRYGTASGNQLTSGRLQLNAIWFAKGWDITSVTFVSGTAAVLPTNQWAALYSPSLDLMGVTADRTTEAWPASTPKTFTFASPVEVLERGLHYVGLMVAATTVPQLPRVGIPAGLLVLPVCAAVAVGSGLTTPATAPDPAVFDTATGLSYFYAS